MDVLQKQIVDLNHKIDRLHQIIERLSCQIAELALDKKHHLGQEYQHLSNIDQLLPHSDSNRNKTNSVMEHKDIISDGSDWENNSNYQNKQTLSPDTQIRRLTAQLTAAYNRIAALEEQLLSNRIHS